MAENIAKIDEKIRELKRKKKAVENREKIKDHPRLRGELP